MSIVVDTNLVVGMVLQSIHTPSASRLFASWLNASETLLAPVLLEYELATVLRREIMSGKLDEELGKRAIRGFYALSIRPVAPTFELHQRALHWAARIGQGKAYDAQYVALAEREGATLWTGDKRLVNACERIQINWVRWIGEA